MVVITQVSRSLLQTDICEHLARSDAGKGSEHASEMPRAQLYQARDRIQSYVPVYVGFLLGEYLARSAEIEINT
jgi:hypothetical protein